MHPSVHVSIVQSQPLQAVVEPISLFTCLKNSVWAPLGQEPRQQSSLSGRCEVGAHVALSPVEGTQEPDGRALY